MNFLKASRAVLAATFCAAATVGHAHGIESQTLTLPVIGAGDSYEVVTQCSHAYAVNGGIQSGDELLASGLEITGSYPKTTKSWAVEITNDTGRPTAINEVNATFYVTCGRH